MRLTTILLSLLICLIACDKQDEQPYINVDKSTVSATPAGETIEIRVTANVDFTLGALPDWITLTSRFPGDKYTILNFQVSENSSGAARQHTINLTAGNIAATIQISQDYFRAVTTSAGSLKNNIQQDFKSVKKLIVAGELNKQDFDFMRDELPNLEYLDLSQVNIKASGIDYPENELPAFAFHTSPGSDGVGKESLKTVILPGSIIAIGTHAFFKCSSLTEIAIPNQVQTIKGSAFGQCSKIEKLTFENHSSLKVINSMAFRECSALKTLELPASLESIEMQAFQSCHALTGDLYIPASVKMIAMLAFDGCRGLTSLTFAENCQINTIKDGAFLNCTGLSGSLSIPASVGAIGSGLFDYGAFEGCTGIRTLVFESRERPLLIEHFSFRDCTSIANTVHLPAQIKEIGKEAFANCNAIEGFEVYWTYPIPTFDQSVWPAGKTFYIPQNYTNTYVTKGWPEADLTERNE